jgi:hypothetical protein
MAMRAGKWTAPVLRKGSLISIQNGFDANRIVRLRRPQTEKSLNPECCLSFGPPTPYPPASGDHLRTEVFTTSLTAGSIVKIMACRAGAG